VTRLIARLGLPEDARAILVTADDFGLCHASTRGVEEVLRSGDVGAAGLLVPAPWSREAAARGAGFDVGVHLALTAGLPRFRWGPVTYAPSLLGGDGGFPAEPADLHDHADPDEVRRECRAQLERAILLGVEPTHLSVHDGALFAEPSLFDVLVELTLEARLPLRLPDPTVAAGFGFPVHALAEERGVVHPDAVRRVGPSERADATALIDDLGEGVTELVVRPALDTDELRDLAPDAADRAGDLDWLRGGVLRAAALDAGVVVLSWVTLRDLVRSEPADRTTW
jgi:chitin disaccharide deacetylase